MVFITCGLGGGTGTGGAPVGGRAQAGSGDPHHVILADPDVPSTPPTHPKSGSQHRDRGHTGVMREEAAEALEQVRAICMALPEMVERPSHGSPAFFVRGKKTVAMFLDDHHGDGRLAIWCPAAPGVQEAMVAEEPGRPRWPTA